MNKERFLRLLNERILILDGGMGTMIQSFKLNEQDYRGERFADFPGQLKGNNDLLCITRPDVIQSIHRQYLDAGADIFATNTFNANAISMADYAMEAYVREINLAAGRLSREVADTYMAEHPDRTIFVAGSIGPTNKTASMSPDVSDPAYRAVTYKDLYNAYKEQVEGLVDGGVDIILFETTFDTLNVKAGLEAAEVVLKEKEKDLPIMLSLTLSAQGGRTFSGQTLLAFLASIQHTHIVSVGLNCSFGAADMKPYLQELAKYAPYYISAYPNAGLPNSFGTYDETPDKMAQHVKPFVEEGLVNIIGGCCGTTPAHISRYPELVKGAKPHIPAPKPDCLWLSGLELLEVKPENNFVNVGERCNVAGSRKFLRLIKEGSYEEALTIARKQVEDGAQVIDINMDDGMLDAVKEMKTFLNLIASEPDIARVPVMIDSSKWEVIEEGLMCVQGKSIVNSISLKEGEEVFVKHAARIKRLGAAAVVMAFDEKGQADTYERKIEICERAYRLLTEKIDFNPQDIIFDPNVLAIATGMEEHNGYGLAFIRAVEWIKKNLPGAKVSGGVSNLSFSFRGNNHVREAMHSVFLYHAIGKGMDMGIVNPSTSVLYEDIEPEFRTLLEDVILARRPEAAEELITYAQNLHVQASGETPEKHEAWRELSLKERLEHALIKGIGDYLEDDLQEALRASLGQKKEVLVSLSEARKHPIEIDWTGYTPVVPARMGVHVIPYIPLEKVIPYIHWTFFFSAWKLNGRFSEISQIHGCDSCRASWLAGFPEKDRAKATEAMQLYKDAVRLLDRLVNMKVEYCKAIYGFFSANSEGDTIRMGDIALPLLRQQVKKEENIYKCLSDYVIPVSEERTDYVGAFVVTAGAGADCLKDKFEEEGDTYNSMLLQTLTDRLAEATAEYLHEKVRKEYWGYAKDESLSIPDLYKVKYQGIRPAIGYPSLPDQLLNFTLDGLLDMSRIGVSLTENGAMYPTASVSGIYIAHPSSQYFMIGSIDEEQMRDYASRRNLTEEQARKLLSKNIG